MTSFFTFEILSGVAIVNVWDVQTLSIQVVPCEEYELLSAFDFRTKSETDFKTSRLSDQYGEVAADIVIERRLLDCRPETTGA